MKTTSNNSSQDFEVTIYKEELSELHKIIEALELDLVATKQQNLVLEDEYRTLLTDGRYVAFEKYYQFSPSNLFIIDQYGVILKINEATLNFLKFDKDTLIGSSFRALLSKRSFTDFNRHFLDFKQSSQKFLQINDLQLKDLRSFSISMSKIASQDDELGIQIACSILSYDVHSIVFMDYLAKVAIDQMHEGVLVTDKSGKILHVNNAFSEITGYPYTDVVGKNPRLLKSGRHNKSFYEDIWKVIEEHGWWAGQVWNKRKNGNVYAQWLQINTLKDPITQSTYYISTIQDITDRISHETELDKLAHYDTLTGLMNRHYITLILEDHINRAQRAKSTLALLFIDLDSFKQINDQYGHDQGDFVLQEASQRLLATIRHTDYVGRIGGDEFVVILPRVQDMHNVKKLSDKIIENLSKVYTVSGNQYYIGASIGIAEYPKDGDRFEDLMKNADSAMYVAKYNGKSQSAFYNKTYSEIAFSYENMKILLHETINNPQENLVVYYQPVINPSTLEMTSVEALVRIYNKKKELVYPDAFIEIAEKEGLIVDLGNAIFESACQFLSSQLHLGKKIPPIAINLSANQLLDKDLFSNFSNIVKKHHCKMSAFHFEVTESTAMQNINIVTDTLKQFQKSGSKILLDDFGTGYSSLAQLHKLPFDIIKIDKSFTDFIDGPESSYTNIICAINSMAKELKMEIIIEGAETEAQIAWIKQKKIDKVQGYYYSKPIDAISLSERYLS